LEVAVGLGVLQQRSSLAPQVRLQLAQHQLAAVLLVVELEQLRLLQLVEQVLLVQPVELVLQVLLAPWVRLALQQLEQLRPLQEQPLHQLEPHLLE